MSSARLGIRVAGLELWLDAAADAVATAPGLTVPLCHAPFLVDRSAGGGLSLSVRDGPLSTTAGWQPIFYDRATWQLWRDGAGRYVFVTSRSSPPPRQIAVDADFRSGEVTGEFAVGADPGAPVFPLQDIDIVIYSNWLARFGDLIVHASGIDDAGAGYAFVGPAGAGKSTLAAHLSTFPDVVALGEDQVIVRYMDGRFLLYGTPWHTNPAFCSPGGVPLRALFFLDRSAEEGARPCTPGAAIERLFPDAFIPYYNRAGVVNILENLSRLAGQVPFYTLNYRLGADVMTCIRGA